MRLTGYGVMVSAGAMVVAGGEMTGAGVEVGAGNEVVAIDGGVGDGFGLAVGIGVGVGQRPPSGACWQRGRRRPRLEAPGNSIPGHRPGTTADARECR